MRCARFKVFGQLDGAGGAKQGTVIVDRVSGLLHVRPFRRKRVYTMPLSMVADMVCKRILMNEVMEKRATKRKTKVTRRRLR